MSNTKVVTDPTPPTAPTNGLGAWYKHQNHYYYQEGDGKLPAVPGDIDVFVNNAVSGIKAALQYAGFGNLNLNNGYFGKAMKRQVKAFQASAFNLDTSQVDGIVGPNTAKKLLEIIAKDVQNHSAIPSNLLIKLISEESNFDPGAQGFATPQDRGANQISLFYHPDVTNAQAMNPVFSIPYGGRLLVSAYSSIKDWDGAIASYNIGMVRATDWVKAGKPLNGMFAGNFDYAAQATMYVSRVKSQSV